MSTVSTVTDRPVYLSVEYSDKDKVKALGARWNPELKLWFVPPQTDLVPFNYWIMSEQPGATTSNHFYILSTNRECWTCKQQTKVHAVSLPPGTIQFGVDEDTCQPVIDSSEFPMLVFGLTYLDDKTVSAFASYPKYRLDFSKTVGQRYLMNHCEHCDAKLGDNFIMESMCFVPTLHGPKASYVWCEKVDVPFQGSFDGITLNFWRSFRIILLQNNLDIDIYPRPA